MPIRRSIYTSTDVQKESDALEADVNDAHEKLSEFNRRIEMQRWPLLQRVWAAGEELARFQQAHRHQLDRDN